ncbi:MAG TPA: WhiB family transcriptional regulator [Actinomycetota bacterium]|jgi:WhiB family transcriptional regulator, redox-sensing transcriptional regulator|nr:WhiB family transcriptional regulator [Actinomycetota bacterium]
MRTNVIERDEVWRQAAACLEHPVEVFYPQPDEDARDALLVCRDCAVRKPCLEAALAAGETFGIWGGLTPAERQTLGR